MAKFSVGSPVRYWSNDYKCWRYGIVVEPQDTNLHIPCDAVWANWFDHCRRPYPAPTYVNPDTHPVHPASHDEVTLAMVKWTIKEALDG